MLRRAFVLAAVIAAAPAVSAAQDAPAVNDVAPPTAAAATKTSAAVLARDPRMIAAIRHANLTADVKCGAGVGANVDLETRATAARCRRRMVDAAKSDTEFDIAGK